MNVFVSRDRDCTFSSKTEVTEYPTVIAVVYIQYDEAEQCYAGVWDSEPLYTLYDGSLNFQKSYSKEIDDDENLWDRFVWWHKLDTSLWCGHCVRLHLERRLRTENENVTLY